MKTCNRETSPKLETRNVPFTDEWEVRTTVPPLLGELKESFL